MFYVTMTSLYFMLSLRDAEGVGHDENYYRCDRAARSLQGADTPARHTCCRQSERRRRCLTDGGSADHRERRAAPAARRRSGQGGAASLSSGDGNVTLGIDGGFGTANHGDGDSGAFVDVGERHSGVGRDTAV